MDSDKNSWSDRKTSRKRATLPLSSHVDFQSDIQTINQDIRRYRALYFSIGTYAGTFTLLQFGFIRYLRNVLNIHDLVNPTVIMLNTSIFYLPWVIKPVFGYLSDIYYPFYRRFKGYVLILGVLSLLITAFDIVFTTQVSLSVEIALSFVRVFALVWTDSLAQGMIAVSLKFEDRKEELTQRLKDNGHSGTRLPDSIADTTFGLFRKPFRTSFKYARSFGFFMAWVTLVRGIFEFIAAFMFDLNGVNPDDSDDINEYIQWVYSIAMPFMLIMVLCFIFIPELRLQTLSSKKKPGSIFMFIKKISPANPWAMLGLAILMVINPSNADNGFVGSVMRETFFIDDPRKLSIIYLSPVIAGVALVIVISSCITFCRFNRANLYLMLQIIFQLLNQGVSIYMWSVNRTTVVSTLPVLMLMFSLSYLAALSTISLPLLAVVENCIYKVPDGHEAFAVNLMSGLIFFGWMMSETVANVLRHLFNIQQYAFEALNYYTAVTLVYTFGTMVLFAFVYSKSMLTQVDLKHNQTLRGSTKDTIQPPRDSGPPSKDFDINCGLLVEAC